MTTYNISISDNTMTVGFGAPGTNAEIVVDAQKALSNLTLGGDLLKITGPASLPVAMVIAHKVAHLYGAVAVFDPKLGQYVVAISHTPKYSVGDLID